MSLPYKYMVATLEKISLHKKGAMMRMHSYRTWIGIVAGALLTLITGQAQAGYYSVLHSTADIGPITTGAAIAVAMPAVDNGRIQITRIRLTTTKSTALDYRFRSARESSAVGDTKQVSSWTCDLPGCSDVFTINGVKAGELYDLEGLQLSLSPGHRLYVWSSADINSDYFTVEVWWREG